jgi:hypothetical protein
VRTSPYDFPQVPITPTPGTCGALLIRLLVPDLGDV